jgi:hypothetical protein
MVSPMVLPFLSTSEPRRRDLRTNCLEFLAGAIKKTRRTTDFSTLRAARHRVNAAELWIVWIKKQLANGS